MIALLTLTAFILFVIYVEQHQIRINLNSIDRTWGRADWVYPVVREQKEWMRTEILQTYK